MLRKYLYMLMVISVGLMATESKAELRDLPQLTVLSTPSLDRVLTEIARSYSSVKEVTVNSSFETDAEQVERISEGNPADIIITSHPQWMSELKQQGLVDIYTIANLMNNSLCFAASKEGTVGRSEMDLNKTLPELFDFVLDRSFIVIGDPVYTSLGIYTLQSLTALNIEEKVLPRVIRAGGAENSYLIAEGEHSGIVFCSDIATNDELLKLATFPEDIHDPIIYQIAVVAGENMAMARDFIDYLKQPDAEKIFKNHGFIVKSEN